ncbi:MAG: site-specific integrase [Fimbriimonadaceae bacterium]|nr:site-specific integrase [Fimbriimonadaceae bacterium]
MADKRSNGEGSIFQRADGRWVAKISLGYDTVNHRRLRKVVYGTTKAEVRKKLTELQRKHDQGVTVNTRSQSVAQFLNHWLNDVAKQKVRDTTYRSYEQIIRNHLIPGLGTYTLEKLTPQVIQSFLNAKAETGISVEHLRRVLRAALNQAMKWELIVRNPATLVTTPNKQTFEFEYLTPEQARKLITAVSNTKHEALFTVAIAVGLRISEALGLRWSDIDLEAGTLRVKYQLSRIGGGIKLVEPKTARARRTIPLPAFAIDSLRRHRVKQLEMRIFNSDLWQEGDFVFTSSVGTPAEIRNVRRTLAKILKENDLPKLRFHDLRHTCATLLLAQGTDARTIMEILGHSQIGLTLNTYAHVMPTLQRDAADRMDAVLGTASKTVGS